MKRDKVNDAVKLCSLLVFSTLFMHYSGCPVILVVPFAVAIATWLVVNDNFGMFANAAIMFGFIALNDLGAKFLGGGINDYEGIGFINGVTMISAGLSFIALSTKVALTKDVNAVRKFLAIIIFPSLFGTYLALFAFVGLDVPR